MNTVSVKRYILLLILCVTSLYLSAQSRHALLIGINKYYKKEKDRTVIDSVNSLEGCINDAKSIKELLTARFGFKENEITEIYDSLATRQNILAGLDSLLSRSDTADIVFVYYSGHGMSYKYGKSEYATAEVICPSDIFTGEKNASVQTSALANKFNKFVDKKIILTVVFDCCFSFGTTGKKNDMYKEAANRQENAVLFDLTAENEEDAVNEESKYAPIKLKDNSFLNTISTPLLPVELSGEKYRGIDFKDYAAYRSDMPGNSVWDFRYEFFPANPPSEKPNSQFLFLSATNDRQKAAEKADESGVRHGVLTKALINVFKESPAKAAMTEVFQKIKSQLTDQYVIQTPQLSTSPVRQHQNLLGVDTSVIQNVFTMRCERISDQMMVFNKGLLSGLSIGNLLAHKDRPSITAEIMEFINEDSSIARITNGSGIFVSPGDTFVVKDWYAKSKKALLKIYIPGEGCTLGRLDTLCRKLIKPLLRDSHFLPYEKSDSTCSKIYISNNGKSMTYVDGKTKKKITKPNPSAAVIRKLCSGQNYFIYLPVPAILTNQIRKECEQNQNFMIVDNPEKADVSLYCAIYKDLMNNVSNNYVKLSSIRFSKMIKPVPFNLVMTGSNENAGKMRINPGHTFTPEKSYAFSPYNMQVASVFVKWFQYKASRRGWLNFAPKSR
ncbi:MAG: caspase family protein [Sphingobacteriales bacterium]|nr:caspase family protein [Sphingobacteriales bacterium]